MCLMGQDRSADVWDQLAAKDRSRDRALQQRGLMVLRYTGSEIYADANACAVEVCRALSRMGSENAELPDRREIGAQGR